MPKEIIDMKIEEVSAVDKAATRKKFLLIKKEGDDTFSKRTLEDVLDNNEAVNTMWKTVDAFYIAINDTMQDSMLSETEKASQIQASAEQLSSKLNDIAPDLAKKLDVEKIVENVKKRLSDEGGETNMNLEEILEKIEDEEVKKAVKTLVDNLKEEKDINKKDDDVINKAELPEELRKQFKELEDKVAMAEEIAKAEREKRLEIEFNKKAQNYSTVGDVDKIASILKRVADDDELQSDVEEVLKSAQERLESGDLFKSLGDDGKNVTDAEEAIEKKTRELMKNDTSLTFAKAQAKVLQENPDLYKEYVSQKN